MTKITGDIDTTPTNYSVTDTTQIASHLEGIDAALATATGRVGSVIYWPATAGTFPANCLQCDGSFIRKESYPELYSVLGTIYGESGGYFALPNYHGWFFRGCGGGTDPDSGSRTDRGDGTTGNNVGTIQYEGYQSHAHQMNRTTNTVTGGGGGRCTGTGTTTTTSNSSTGNETRPDNIYVYKLIIYKATP